MSIFRAWKHFLGDAKENAMQSEEDIRRRELQERLISEHRQANARARSEHRQANARAREELREIVPVVNARYVATMAQAMEIIKGH